MATYPTNPNISSGTTSTEVNVTNWNIFVDNINAIGADIVGTIIADLQTLGLLG